MTIGCNFHRRQFRSIRGERYLVVGLIQTLIQIEFSTCTGYQVCEKWLKDRKGWKLLKNDIEHYQRIVGALNETIRLMKEIDVVIDKYGGWPDAFSEQSENLAKLTETRA